MLRRTPTTTEFSYDINQVIEKSTDAHSYIYGQLYKIFPSNLVDRLAVYHANMKDSPIVKNFIELLKEVNDKESLSELLAVVLRIFEMNEYHYNANSNNYRSYLNISRQGNQNYGAYAMSGVNRHQATANTATTSPTPYSTIFRPTFSPQVYQQAQAYGQAQANPTPFQAKQQNTPLQNNLKEFTPMSPKIKLENTKENTSYDLSHTDLTAEKPFSNQNTNFQPIKKQIFKVVKVPHETAAAQESVNDSPYYQKNIWRYNRTVKFIKKTIHNEMTVDQLYELENSILNPDRNLRLIKKFVIDNDWTAIKPEDLCILLYKFQGKGLYLQFKPVDKSWVFLNKIF
jgi:hypothetical protein